MSDGEAYIEGYISKSDKSGWLELHRFKYATELISEKSVYVYVFQIPADNFWDLIELGALIHITNVFPVYLWGSLVGFCTSADSNFSWPLCKKLVCRHNGAIITFRQPFILDEPRCMNKCIVYLMWEAFSLGRLRNCLKCAINSYFCINVAMRTIAAGVNIHEFDVPNKLQAVRGPSDFSFFVIRAAQDLDYLGSLLPEIVTPRHVFKCTEKYRHSKLVSTDSGCFNGSSRCYAVLEPVGKRKGASGTIVVGFLESIIAISPQLTVMLLIDSSQRPLVVLVATPAANYSVNSFHFRALDIQSWIERFKNPETAVSQCPMLAVLKSCYSLVQCDSRCDNGVLASVVIAESINCDIVGAALNPPCPESGNISTYVNGTVSSGLDSSADICARGTRGALSVRRALCSLSSRAAFPGQQLVDVKGVVIFKEYVISGEPARDPWAQGGIADGRGRPGQKRPRETARSIKCLLTLRDEHRADTISVFMDEADSHWAIIGSIVCIYSCRINSSKNAKSVYIEYNKHRFKSSIGESEWCTYKSYQRVFSNFYQASVVSFLIPTLSGLSV
jgi:hypothetical protein